MALTAGHLRGNPALRRFYGRSPVVVACTDDAEELEALVAELGRLGAELVVEREPGPLSAVLGRPSVTVCDRYLDVQLHVPRPPSATVLSTVLRSQVRCEECPQAADELRNPWAEVGRANVAAASD